MSTRRTADYNKWFAGLADAKARQRIDARIGLLEAGHPGDAKPIGKGASELRFFFGPGYRVYYLQEGEEIVLLFGGNKSSRDRDIARALAMLED